jgi:CheY-like chemotaxis protein
MLKNSTRNIENFEENINHAENAIKSLENFIKLYFKKSMKNRFLNQFDILYVEDNELDRKTISTYFGKLGYQVKTAKDAQETLAILKEAHPQVILMDISLRTSKIDGDQLAKILKSQERFSDIPIFLISALIEESQKHILLEKSGADAIILKPIKTLSELDRITEYIA